MAEVLHITTTNRKQVVDLSDQLEVVIRRAKMQGVGYQQANWSSGRGNRDVG